MSIARLTDEELNDLAVGIVKGETYCVNDSEAVRLSFGHIIGMMDEPFDAETREQIGAFYEDFSKAGPRSINGYPMFFSLNILHIDDVGPLSDKIEAKRKALSEA